MTTEELKSRLIGRTIVGVVGEWDEYWIWLANKNGSVEIRLDDGTVISSVGEPVCVALPTAPGNADFWAARKRNSDPTTTH